LAGSISDILRFISLYSRVKEAKSYEELVPLIPELDSILAELLRNGALTTILSGVEKLAGNAGKKCDVDTDPNTARSGPNFKRKGDGDGDPPVGKPGEPTLAPNQCNTPPVVPSPDVPKTPTADQEAKDLLKSLTDGKERNPDGTPKSSAPSNTPSDKSTTTQRDSKTDAPNKIWSKTDTPWGRSVLRRSDVDWNYVRPDGLGTNAQAARRGYAPIRPNAKGGHDLLVLHHMNNDPGGSVVEVWSSTHNARHAADRLNGRRIAAGDPRGVPDTLLNWRDNNPQWASDWNTEQAVYWKWVQGVYTPPPGGVRVPPTQLGQ